MKIHAIQTGTVAIKERQRVGEGSGMMRMANTLLDSHWTEPLPIYAWLIEHPEGLILVDTGETARATEPGYFPVWHPYYRMGVREWVKPEEEIGPQLRQMGIAPRDVRWLVLTHLHTDHAGGLYHFESVDTLVARTEYEAASGMGGRLKGYLPNRWPDWFAPRLIDFDSLPFGPFPTSLSLTKAGDVRLVPTPGHSPGHLSVIVQDGETAVFLAGDVSYTQDALLAQVVDGVAPDVEAAKESLRRTLTFARSTPTIYLPSHDPDSVRRLAMGVVVSAEAIDERHAVMV